MRAEISDGLRSTGESQTVLGDTLRLRSTCPNYGSNFCWVNYEIRVPADLALQVDSSDGSVRISGTTGPITVDGDNGSVRLADVSGPLQVSTDNGRVEGIQLRSQQVTADADNGRVQLQFDDGADDGDRHDLERPGRGRRARRRHGLPGRRPDVQRQ